MPLVGLIDPSHDERAADEPGRLPRWTPIEQLLEDAIAKDPTWSPWTYELLHAAMEEWQERDYISTTMLTGGCPRGTVLERKEPFLLDADQLYAALRGTQVHRTLEKSARPGSVAEARFFTTLFVPGHGDMQISCSPDLVTRDTLWDYKVTENPPTFDYPWRSHTKQLQYNRYIVNHAEKWTLDGEPFDIPFNPRTWQCEHLAVVYLGPKGPKVIECRHTIDVPTPNGKTVRRKRPFVWDDELVLEGDKDIGTGLITRLKAMADALDAYPEWPDGLETVWGGPAGWRCPGKPLCNLPNCLAARYPDNLTWPVPE